MFTQARFAIRTGKKKISLFVWLVFVLAWDFDGDLEDSPKNGLEKGDGSIQPLDVSVPLRSYT